MAMGENYRDSTLVVVKFSKHFTLITDGWLRNALKRTLGCFSLLVLDEYSS